MPLEELYPRTPTAQCELCKQFDASGNLDWISKAVHGITVVVFGHKPGLGCNQEPNR